MSEFLLRGLDGANPLGFLAAIGALRTATAAWPASAVRMGWTQQSGGWRPRLEIAHVDVDEDVFLETLDAELKKMEGHAAFSFSDGLPVAVDLFAIQLKAAFSSADSSDRSLADFLVAFGSDAFVDENGRISDTALRAVGGGQQRFLLSAVELIQNTEAHHLRSALFQEWKYQDDKPSMRWDPADDRRYALRWNEPSGDPVKTVRGANRLAIEALPLLPTIPVGRRLETTGFTYTRNRRQQWTWPIWEVLVCLDIVRSLLALGDLQVEIPDRDKLSPMGVAEVFRCQRITKDKYKNFTPAEPA